MPLSSPAAPAAVVPCGGLPPRGTCYPSPGGEDHLKRRSSSPPVPPLLGCRHCPKESISCHSGGKPWTSLCAGYLLGRFCKCRKRSNAGDARGAAPCMKITLISPFPSGEGGRGDRGQESKLKAGAGGQQGRHAPRRARGSLPFSSAARVQARDARGAAPCMKITLISPFPTGEGGRGDRGQEGKLKAGAGGATKKASPPLDFPQRQG